MVWAESPHVPGRPTLLIYGHYDVQPPDPLEEWVTPPFEPTVRDGALYARGAADDKGQVFCLLKAYEAMLDADRRPPLNVHFIFEGEEESGGHVIADLLRAEPERTRADAALVCDMSYYAPGWPAVYTALRGPLLRRDLGPDAASATCTPAPTAASRPTRSRRWSGILAKLKDADGEIQIPKLYKAVEPPTKQELKTWKQLPFDKATYLREEVTGAGAHRAQGVLDLRAGLGASHLRDPRHQGRLRGRGGEDGDPRAGDGQGEPAPGAGAELRQGGEAARARGGGAGAPVGRGEGHPAPRRRSGAGRRRPSRRSRCWTRRSRR